MSLFKAIPALSSFETTKWSVKVHFGNGQMEEFPFIFLRDNCPCPVCTHPTSFDRMLLLRNVPLDIVASQVQITDDNNLVIKRKS